MQNRRTFLKMGVAGSAFLPVFAELSAKAEQKDATVKRKKEINIGIVGFGSMGYILSGSLVRCEGVRVICVCDIWKFRLFQAKHFFKEYKQEIKQYYDFNEMLDAEAKNLNAVIVASPDWMHCDQVCECLRRGLHVHCASPMADTLEKAAAMCRVAKASGRLLQIGDQRRILPVYRLAFEHVVPEMLGRLVFAHAENRMSMHPMNMFKRPPKDDVLAKYGYGNAEQYINWKWFRKYGLGSALETLASQTDLFCRAWGTPPCSVTAVGGCDIFRPPRENLDNLSSVFEFKQPDGSLARATHRFVIAHKCTSPTYEEFNGLRAVLRLSTCWFSPKSDGPANYVRRTWNLSREEYAKEWRTFVDNGWILPSEWERKLKEIVDCDCNPTEPADESTVCPLNVKKENKSAYRLLMENFLAAIRGEAKLEAPADSLYASMVAAFGAMRSAARRETVYFKPEDFTP